MPSCPTSSGVWFSIAASLKKCLYTQGQSRNSSKGAQIHCSHKSSIGVLHLCCHSNSPLGHLSLTHPHKQISLQIFPSKQHGLTSSIILTLSVLALTAQDVSSSQFAGNVKGIMVIYVYVQRCGTTSGGP